MIENDFILLLQIYSHRQLEENDLTIQLGITKSQLNYRITKINDWLMRNSLSTLRRDSKRIVFDEELTIFIETLDFTNLPVSHLDQDSRIVLIFMIIAISKESLSLNHLAQYVSVSKNTILMDIRIIKDDLRLFNLELEYSRSKGYKLSGNEFNIRRFGEYYVDKIQNPHLIINELSIVEPNIERLIDNYQNLVFHVENELKTRYSDRVIESSPLYFYFVDQRISKGNIVGVPDSEHLEEMKSMGEFAVVKRLRGLYFYSQNTEDEELFLTLYFLSVNKMESDLKIYSIQTSDLNESIMESINLFENNSTMIIENKEVLADLLATHLSAAFYRYRYAIRSPYQITISTQMRLDLEEIYYFISRSIYPIEVVMNLELPEEEIFFIASYIGGHLKTQSFIGEEDKGILNAIVICENGLVYSNILMNSLKQMFKNVNFLSVMSVRDYHTLKTEMVDIDIVFSSKYIASIHNLVVVNSFNTEEESRVIKEVNEIMKSKGHFSTSVVGDVMALIPNELSEGTRMKVRNELELYFSVEHKDQYQTKLETFGLSDKLTEKNIKFESESKIWTDILIDVGNELISSSYMQHKDLEEFLVCYPEPSMEILFGGTVLVPHIRVRGTAGFQLRLIILTDPIFLESIEVNLILVMITGDDDSHVRAVYELHQLSMSPEIHEISEMYESKKIANKILSLKFNESREEY